MAATRGKFPAQTLPAAEIPAIITLTQQKKGDTTAGRENAGAPGTATTSSRARARPSRTWRVSPQVKVSESMVAAGVAVLWASGAVEGWLDSDELLVSEIFEAMAKAGPSREP